jgi:hypothetical protein
MTREGASKKGGVKPLFTSATVQAAMSPLSYAAMSAVVLR